MTHNTLLTSTDVHTPLRAPPCRLLPCAPLAAGSLARRPRRVLTRLLSLSARPQIYFCTLDLLDGRRTANLARPGQALKLASGSSSSSHSHSHTHACNAMRAQAAQADAAAHDCAVGSFGMKGKQYAFFCALPQVGFRQIRTWTEIRDFFGALPPPAPPNPQPSDHTFLRYPS
jgi:hypothetical protein